MRKILVIILVVYSLFLFSESFPARAADKLTMNDFLATAQDDPRLQNHTELVRYLEAAPESTAYLDKIQFRTESDEFDISKQKYSLRFYPKAWGETRYNTLIAETTRKAVRTEHEALFNRALEKRYKLVLDFLETLSLINLKKRLLMVYNDRVNVLRKLSMSDLSSDASVLVSAEDRHIALQIELVQLENKLTAVVEEIKFIAGHYPEIAFDEDQLIGPEKIEEIIRDIQPGPNPDNIYLREKRYNAELAENRYLLEKTKSKKRISFFKVQYDADDYDRPEKAFSFEMGFDLPFVNSDREDINRRKKNYLEEKLGYENKKRNTSEKITSLSRSLKRLIRQRRILADRRNNSNAEISFRKYMKMEGINPLTLLKVKESILEGDIQLARISYMIRRRYLELTDIMGRLSGEPLRNLISVFMEPIQ